MIPLDPVAKSPVHPVFDRVMAGVVLAAAGFFVWFLLQVPPDPRGHGTHVAFGMQPCGWALRDHTPCPTCGVTTAACHLVHLQPWQALKAQPFGLALALFGLWLAGVGGYCLARGKSYFDYLMRLPQWRILTWGCLLLLASWLYKYWTFQP